MEAAKAAGRLLDEVLVQPAEVRARISDSFCCFWAEGGKSGLARIQRNLVE